MTTYRQVIGAVLVVVLLTATAVAVVPSVTAQEDSPEDEADAIQLSIALQPGGDAALSMEYRLALDTQSDRDAFDELAAEISENEESYLQRFEERFGPVVDDASSATDRDMAMEDLSVSTDTRLIGDRQFGLVSYTFDWTAFAIVDGPEIHAGDALSGLFLTEEMTLTVTWPGEYGLVHADPTPDRTEDTLVSWSGPTDFDLDEPRITISSDIEVTPVDDDSSMFLITGVLVGVVLLLTAGGWYVWRKRDTGADSPIASDETPDELLSNEEQVLQLVHNHGGRMKQAEVAEALGWTAAKTSKVVGNLRESDDLEAFRLGRENVLRLPEEEESS